MIKRFISMLLVITFVVAIFPNIPFTLSANDPGEDIRLIAHYPLAGDALDTQRNQYNATLNGTGAKFVGDETFGTVLDLSGGAQGTSYVKIPGASLVGVGNTTIMTWVYPRGTSSYSRIFDFGINYTRNFYLTTRHSGSSFSARLTINGSGAEQTCADASALAPDQWHHVAVTLDETGKTMTLYKNGVLVKQIAITAGLKDVLNQTNAAANLLYIGRSQYGDGDINAKYSDFRIYNEVLSVDEIQKIRTEKFTDEAVVAADLGFITSSLGILENRTANFTLPTSTLSGSTVKWVSFDNNIINAETGTVTRPPNTNPNPLENVTLSVTVTKGDVELSKDYIVSVLRLPSDIDIVNSDMNTISIKTGTLTEDIDLPITGELGSTISWASNAPQFISDTGKVTRPTIGNGNIDAILTATIGYGSESITKEFNVIIKQETEVPILIGVANISVASPKGILPKLPYYVPGIYKDGKEGPMVRVIWPAPTNTNDYQDIGKTIISGTVTSTNYQPKAYVTIVDSENFTEVQNDRLGIVVSGDEILVSNQTINANVSISNNNESPTNTKVIMALYNAKGLLVDITMQDKEIGSKTNEDFILSLTAPEDVSDYKAKVFVWDANTMIPLISNLTITEIFETGNPELILEKFNLSQVILDDAENGNKTVFEKNSTNMINALLSAKDDSFLYMFRQTFSIAQPSGATALGGWDTESTKLRGHATGHYLTSLAQAYASTANDPETQAKFKTKIDYMIDNLYDMSKLSKGSPTQVPVDSGKTAYTSELALSTARKDYENWGEGFISAYPPDQFIMLESYATYGSNNNQIWAPYYTLHKILAGLVDCYEVAGNEKALEIAKGMGLWVSNRLSQLPQAQLTRMWDIYIAGEYGGMNETLAKLYSITGDDRFLDVAKNFDNYSFFFGTPSANYTNGLANNVDTIRTRHANQHLPQIIGALTTYDDTKDIKYYNVADNFWDKIVNSYTYSIGGNGGANNNECFTSQPDTIYSGGGLIPGRNTCETCATYNMLKLSTQLFMHNPDAKYMDYYERALYNDIAASINPSNAGNVYFFPLTPGAARSYGNANLSGFTCCNGTALESHTKYQDSIYLHGGDDTLYVNLYIPSTLKWNDSISISQTTNFPYADTTTLTVNGSGAFDMKLRVPYWATNGFNVYVNGDKMDITTTPSSYISINRVWADGDTVQIVMPMDFHLFETMDQPNIASVFYGPMILAGVESSSLAEYRPITLDAENLSNSIQGNTSTLTFTTNERTIKPLYDFGTARYSTYFDITLEK